MVDIARLALRFNFVSRIGTKDQHRIMGGAIISEWGAASFRYEGRHHPELGGGFLRNQHTKRRLS